MSVKQLSIITKSDIANYQKYLAKFDINVI